VCGLSAIADDRWNLLNLFTSFPMYVIENEVYVDTMTARTSEGRADAAIADAVTQRLRLRLALTCHTPNLGWCNAVSRHSYRMRLGLHDVYYLFPFLVTLFSLPLSSEGESEEGDDALKRHRASKLPFPLLLFPPLLYDVLKRHSPEGVQREERRKGYL